MREHFNVSLIAPRALKCTLPSTPIAEQVRCQYPYVHSTPYTTSTHPLPAAETVTQFGGKFAVSGNYRICGVAVSFSTVRQTLHTGPVGRWTFDRDASMISDLYTGKDVPTEDCTEMCSRLMERLPERLLENNEPYPTWVSCHLTHTRNS